jgi:GIY-YIG catalytic domain
MLTFNAVLRYEEIDPKTVQLVRHQDNRSAVQCTPYNLWRLGGGGLELYQRLQKKRVFNIGGLLASFVATPSEDTLFVGLYRVGSVGIAPNGTIDPVLQQERGGHHLYDVQPDSRLSDYIGHLVIDWGKGFRAWVQRAHLRDKQIVEIRKDVKEQPFPGFTDFCWDIEQIKAVPLAWQEVLRHVQGVYLLTCKDTGKQYVGSAKGEESLWGRFCDYEKTGHGGNIEMKRLATRNFQVTVLEVVNSDTQQIELIEEAWKKKLMTRKFGLNKN